MPKEAVNPKTIARNAERMEIKRLRDPAYWEANATLMRDPDFARISRNYAERLRNGK